MKAIRIAVSLVYSFGYNAQTLFSTNTVIPIAYYVMMINNLDNFVEASRYRDDRSKIQKWFTASLLKRSFSGTSDNVLRQIREVLNGKYDTFPFDNIIDEFKGKDNSYLPMMILKAY